MKDRRDFFHSAAALAVTTGAVGVPFTAHAASSSTPSVGTPRLALPALPETVPPIVGSDAWFPVRRIYCIGRNYLAHMQELNHDTRESPFFFQKARDMLVLSGTDVRYPSLTVDCEHEIELVLAMQSGGVNVSAANALDHVYGYAVGLDMTRRDLRNTAQRKRQPWEAGKSFEQSAPCSAITPVGRIGHPEKGRIHLSINDRTVTDGDIEDMIRTPAEIIAHLSTRFEIRAGDLIYTGAPRGTGQVQMGGVLLARIDGRSDLRIPIVQPEDPTRAGERDPGL